MPRCNLTLSTICLPAIMARLSKAVVAAVALIVIAALFGSGKMDTTAEVGGIFACTSIRISCVVLGLC